MNAKRFITLFNISSFLVSVLHHTSFLFDMGLEMVSPIVTGIAAAAASTPKAQESRPSKQVED